MISWASLLRSTRSRCSYGELSFHLVLGEALLHCMLGATDTIARIVHARDSSGIRVKVEGNDNQGNQEDGRWKWSVLFRYRKLCLVSILYLRTLAVNLALSILYSRFVSLSYGFAASRSGMSTFSPVCPLQGLSRYRIPSYTVPDAL